MILEYLSIIKQPAGTYIYPRSTSLRQRTVWSTQGKQEYSNPAIWVWYGPCSQKSALFFQRSGTRISWSRGVFGEWKTPLKSSSQRGAFHFFCCFFLFRFFVASLLSINRKSSIRFAWWVHISEVKYYDGKRQVSEFARFKVFPIFKKSKWTRHRQKTERGTSLNFVSTRRSQSGISNEWAGNDCSRLCPASIFSFFHYLPNFAIKSMLCPKLHILGLTLPDFGVHF